MPKRPSTEPDGRVGQDAVGNAKDAKDGVADLSANVGADMAILVMAQPRPSALGGSFAVLGAADKAAAVRVARKLAAKPGGVVSDDGNRRRPAVNAQV